MEMRKKCTRWDSIGFAGLLLAAGAATAQVEQGRFVGKVFDPTGAAVPGAAVTARNTATNISQKALTNGTGEYVITPVPAVYIC